VAAGDAAYSEAGKGQKDLWEVRSNIKDGIARTFFTIDGAEMILLHGFEKKSQATLILFD
jgi:phage-related protein